ncbi:MAG: plasmid partitioning protein [Frankia sp.]|nr:plasmid partitioning protein [Frankia sp.]
MPAQLTKWWGANKKKVLIGGIVIVVIWAWANGGSGPDTKVETIPDRYASADREVRVHAEKDADEPLPLVLVLHDNNTAAETLERDSDASRIADRRDFAVVYPEAVGGTWRVDPNGPDAQYLRDVVSYLAEEWTAIDPNRVYVWGIGEGARLALAVGCADGSQFAAIGVVGQFDPEPGPNCEDRVPSARIREAAWDEDVTKDLWDFSKDVTRAG